MEAEARAANINQGFEREAAAERRHQAVMAIIPAALRQTKSIQSTAIVPLSRNTAFVGRTRELNKIHQYLSRSISGPRAEPVIVAVRGIGGVGKTQVALEYLYRHQPYYKGRFWIRAEDPIIVQQDFAQINGVLDPEGASSIPLRKAVRDVKDWLSTTPDMWLLVFDNVTTAANVQKYIPTLGRGSVLVTTRDRDIADTLGQWTNTIELEGLQGDDSATLLRGIEPRIPDNDLTRKIVDDLGSLPLAICQMGSYIRQTQCSVEQFNVVLQSQSERFFSDTASAITLQYSANLAECCDLTIGLLSEHDMYLLGVLAYFQTDEIQERLITQGCHMITKMGHLADTLNWNDAIRTLTKYSLVTPLFKGSERSLRLHRVVKHRVIHSLDAIPDRNAEAFEDAARLLNRMFPSRPADGGTMTKHHEDCELWLPHVLSLKKNFARIEQPRTIPHAYVEVLCNCSWFMWERGFEQVSNVTAHALQVGEEILRADDTLLSDIYTIASCMKFVVFKSRRDCIDLFKKAADVRERYMAKTPIPSLHERQQLANVHNNVGASMLVNEDWQNAMASFQKSLDLKYQLGDEGTIPYDIAVSLYNICRVQMGLGMIDEAKSNAKRALELTEAHNGPDDFRTNQFRFTFAELLVASGKVQEGIDMHERTLDIRKRVMGPGNNDTGVSYYGLSCVYQQTGRLEDALTNIENAVKVFTKITDAEDRIARSWFRQHLILQELGKMKESEKALSEARRYKHNLTGDESSQTDSLQEYDFFVSYYNK